MRRGGIEYQHNGKVYEFAAFRAFVADSVNERNLRGNNKGIYYYNVPASFDIETTSAATQGGAVKVAFMYVWQFGINGRVIYGRTWDEFTLFCGYLVKALQLCEKRRLLVYVHNLGFEFQYIRKRFEWHKVFSIDVRRPLYAITAEFIEFRCSYLLSGYSLETVGKHLQKYKVSKLVGELDYLKIRTSATPLTGGELDYCFNDVRVVMAYIMELKEQYGGIDRLPLTNTGKVRRKCRYNCLYYQDKDGKKKRNFRYRDLMNTLTMSGIKEFDALQKAFLGGFTHANAVYSMQTVENVASYDFTSSYPFVMLSEKFPMSRGIMVQPQSGAEIAHYIYSGKYCAIMYVCFTEIIKAIEQETYITAQNCTRIEGAVYDNGRIVAAKYLELICTNIDIEIIRKCYNAEKCVCRKILIYKADYLPKPFAATVVELYKTKTVLKGVAGSEQEYQNAKGMLNSCYGMCVTNPLRDEITYEGGHWGISRIENREEKLYNYEFSQNRFLFYPWGVFVTAYARRNLWTGILECGSDYVYSDTDSVKIRNHETHMRYFEDYNHGVIEKLKRAAAYYGFSFEDLTPKTQNGDTKPLGVWDFEGVFKRFKTLGAKRYLVEKEDGEFSLTVAGLNKRVAMPYLLKKYGADGVFRAFTNGLYIPEEGTGKNLLTYIDVPQRGTVVDYMGNVGSYEELTALHLGGVDYSMNLTEMYLRYLMGIRLQKPL